METWRLFAGIIVMLVIWAVAMVALGNQPGPAGLAVAVVAAAVGVYMGERIGNRLTGAADED